MDRKKLELTALYEVSKILGSSLDLNNTLKNVMKTLSVFLDMQRGTVALKADGGIEMKAAHGLTASEIKLGKYKLGEGIIGRVAKSGYPVVIPNVGKEPLFLNKTGARKGISKDNIAFLCVPIKYGNEVLGVLSVDRLFSSENISFEEDLRILKIIATLISQTVKLYRQVEQEKEELISERDELKRELKGKYRVENIIGSSDRMLEVFEAVHRVAPSKATVLLRGESGTGKELVAKAIHYTGPRARQAFIKFNCAAVPEGLLESELFGHEKGAFTGAVATKRGRFELADKGSIFLDEIGDLPIGLQAKVLRILQERELERVGGEKTIKVDIRIIAATSRDLEALLSVNTFREDLYYRLNVVPLVLPPLRDRKDDIPELAEFFLKKYNEENAKRVDISTTVLKKLMEYHWPGNVRELENTMERLVVMSKGSTISLADLPVNPILKESFKKGSLTGYIEDTERENIIAALEKTDWVHAKAARLLGLTPRQIGYKIKKYGIVKQIAS